VSDDLKLLGTDLDRTLLPNGPDSESAEARPRFRALCSKLKPILVYVSGRDKSLVQKAIYAYMLPQPDFVISDVGTNIYDLRAGDWQLLPQWHEHIGHDWNDFNHDQLLDLLSPIKGLRLQEYSKQNTYKLSYYFSLNADREKLDRQLSESLQQHQIQANLIWSIDEPAAVGLLDILPRQADKLHALNYLSELLEIPSSSILFAGDSGNDLPLLISEVPSVLVANAMGEVREEALKLAEMAGHGDRLYCAKGGLLGMNGNYSAGILEGAAHFFPQTIETISAEESAVE
jgi:sucrose-6-phosphatase